MIKTSSFLFYISKFKIQIFIEKNSKIQKFQNQNQKMKELEKKYWFEVEFEFDLKFLNYQQEQLQRPMHAKNVIFFIFFKKNRIILNKEKQS